MDRVRVEAARIKGLEPYDPSYLPARVYLNANENPYGIPASALAELQEKLAIALLNRYPDPLARHLRERLASEQRLEPESVLLGNGGDELLFCVCLAYGGSGRRLLVAPPTFSVYAVDAVLTDTRLVPVARREEVVMAEPGAGRSLRFAVDQQEILRQVRRGDIDIVMLTSPNNPSGDCLGLEFVRELLDASDALVLIDHAYIEFSDPSFNVQPLLREHQNLAVLRTFSKAYALAGLRIGYLLAAPEVIRQLQKARQPYSVDSLAALAALAVLDQQAEIDSGVARIVAQRRRLQDALSDIEQLLLVPSQANYLLFRLPYAHEVWQLLYEEYSILLRDFSRAPGLTDCLRVSVGTSQENSEFLAALRAILTRPAG